jgi:DNA-directed RNA polymerase specialized sigma24 family protein
MCFADAYSYGEIATALGLPLGTVKARIHLARCREEHLPV